MTVNEIVEICLSSARRDPRHDLKLGLRRRLWCSFDVTGADGKSIGHKRRVKLSALAVERVLPLWEEMLPVDRTPHEALDMVQRLYNGEIAPDAADRKSGGLWTHCDALLDGQNANAVMVGYGAIRVVTGALWDGFFRCGDGGDDVVDLDVDTYEADASWFCAVAYSAGATWEAGSDSTKRLEWWTWWLTSAVREALGAS